MKTSWLMIPVIASMIVTGQAPAALAHMRNYPESQDYYTSKKGEVEFELHTDYNMPKPNEDGTHNLKQQYELEYGLTDHLQLSYYEVVTWNRANDFQRDSFKLETKYRLAESGEWPVDVALYAEYKNPNGRQETASDELEGKLILAKNFGRWDTVFNWVMERQIGAHESWQMEYTAGGGYIINPKLRLNLELRETLGDVHEFGIRRKAHELQLIPSIGFSPTANSRVLIGPAIGLTNAADDLQIKSIVSVEF